MNDEAEEVPQLLITRQPCHPHSSMAAGVTLLHDGVHCTRVYLPCCGARGSSPAVPLAHASSDATLRSNSSRSEHSAYVCLVVQQHTQTVTPELRLCCSTSQHNRKHRSNSTLSVLALIHRRIYDGVRGGTARYHAHHVRETKSLPISKTSTAYSTWVSPSLCRFSVI